jgi:hypothetical protein
VRVRERGDRLQIAASQVSLVQAADGSVSHEQFEVPSWLASVVSDSNAVGVVAVEHGAHARSANGGGNGAAPASMEHTNGASATKGQAGALPESERPLLRFFLHESDDGDADRRRLDALIALIEQHPGDGVVRLFIHARDHDKIELSMPDAHISDELRDAGIALLGDLGGAEPIAWFKPRKTRGVEPLEVS